MRTRRLVSWATSSSWVAITIVTPALACRLLSTAMTSFAVAESRLPVGSSAMMTLGLSASAPGDRDPLLLAT